MMGPWQIFLSALPVVPGLIAIVITLVLALIQWQRHPTASAILAVASVWYGGLVILIQGFWIAAASTDLWSTLGVGVIFLIQMGMRVLGMLGWFGVLAAVFVGRAPVDA